MKRYLIVSVIALLGSPCDKILAQSVDEPCPWPAPAQFLMDRASPPDSLMFSVDDTAGKVCYSRPRANGRVVMGELVSYGRLWRTGANEPTLLYLSRAAEVAGVELNAGRYVLLTIPEQDAWTIIFSTSDAAEPMKMFDERVEVGRGTVPVMATDGPVEAFTIRFERGSSNGELVLEWELTRVRIPIGTR